MKQKIKHLLIFVVLLAIDQTSKYWARTYLQENGPVEIIPGVLKLQYNRNSGAVWGILQGQIVLLTVVTVILIVFLSFIYIKIPKDRKYNPLKIIWVFIMAGAIGNFIDRITLRYVVDFIYFYLIDFPLFNFADSCLTVSCIVMLFLALFYYKDTDFAFIDELISRKKKQQPEHEKGSEKKDQQTDNEKSSEKKDQQTDNEESSEKKDQQMDNEENTEKKEQRTDHEENSGKDA